MIKFFQKIFKKTPPAPVQPVPVPRAAPEPAAPVVKVETASLSLAAILSRFPTDLKETIAKPPDPSVMVALPLSIILKQLPSGSVKMSLVSIYRQAPPGTFTAPRMEEKRLVEVPLGEIFKRVKPELLKRRDDQRMNTLAEDDSLDVFGDPNNPFMVSPVGGPVPAEEPPAESYEEAPTEPNTIPTARAVGMLPTAGRSAQPDGMRVVQPPPGFGAPIARPAAPVAPPPAPTVPVLVLPLVDISAGWPEAARVEFPSGPAAVVSLPLDEVAKGLAKGRVSFTWGQIRSWISPAILEASRLPQDLEIQLPLRVVAPAFLKSGKQATTRKKIAVDDEIPALFAGAAKPEPEPEPEPVPEPVVAMPTLKLKPEREPEPAPVIEPPAMKLAFEPEPVEAAPVEAEGVNVVEIDEPLDERVAEPVVEQIEEPVAVTETVDEATEEPVAVTEAVEEAAEEPVAVTETVEEATEEPVAVTEAVEEVTEEPVAVTEAVEEVTEEPVAVTEAVEEATEEPVAVTEAVEEATEEPVAVTEAVEEATEEPVAVTEAVEEATEEPVAVTEAVEEATEEPVAVTEAVEEATEGHIAADEAIKEGAEGPIAVLDEPVTESDTTAVVPADELEAVAAPEPIKDGSEGPIPVLDEPAFKASEEPVAVEPVEEPAASAPVTEARTMGELFGEPDKEHWSPSEIVTACCRLPQFAGALVSLHEGLVVAESLPDSMRGEDVAAFLPQMFTRLNQYSDEMKLGTLDDLLMRTNGAEFQVFRLAMVFFAVLGKPGHNLPRRELELIAEELARQTQK